MINIAIFGYGTVGSGIAEVIRTNQTLINKKSGEEINIKYILDLREFPGDPCEKLIVHDASVILEDPDVHIICEAMGGIKPAYEFSKQALLSGKSVCTSNKELVASHGPELLKIAAENKCNYMFEASVGGGIPIIRPLNTSLTSENIEGITGILNGTTNYILTKMEREGIDFDIVLKEAQEKGYAERNPEADVEGHDACRKIAILSSLAYGKTVNYQEIYTEGITNIETADFVYGKKLGVTIKLLGMSKQVNGKYFAMVAPFMISKEYPLYCVNDVYNGILVKGNTLGDTMYYGQGAGKLPTASAVVSDVIECAKNIGKTVCCFWDSEKLDLESMENDKRRFFVRVKGNAKEAAKEAFGNVSYVDCNIEHEFAFVTEVISEKEYKEYATKMGGVLSMIRIEE